MSKRTVNKAKYSVVVDDKSPKWFVKKRTKSGVYITIAEGETRKEVIDQLKADSETYKK